MAQYVHDGVAAVRVTSCPRRSTQGLHTELRPKTGGTLPVPALELVGERRNGDRRDRPDLIAVDAVVVVGQQVTEFDDVTPRHVRVIGLELVRDPQVVETAQSERLLGGYGRHGP